MPYPLGHGANCVRQWHVRESMRIYLNAPRIPQTHFLIKTWVLALRGLGALVPWPFVP